MDAVSVGARAPDFSSRLQDGTPFRFSSLRGKPTVLYFYPEADTAGCTIEAQGFRDHYAEFGSRGVEIVGVSTDDCPAQLAFAKKYGLPFALVADSERTVASAYGVLNTRGRARRVTFLIDPSGTVAEVVDTPSPPPHLERARARFLKA